MGNFADVVVDQGDIRGVHGNVAANAPHGDAHLGLFQGGGVVDAVADHADRLAPALIPVDDIQLVLGQAAPFHLADPQLPGDGLGRLLVVPSQQHGSDPRRLYLGDGLGRVRAQGVRQGEEAGQLSVRRQVHHRAALGEKLPGSLFRLGGKGNPRLPQKRRVPRQHVGAPHLGPHPAAREHLEVLRLGELRVPRFLIAPDNGLAQRVL